MHALKHAGRIEGTQALTYSYERTHTCMHICVYAHTSKYVQRRKNNVLSNVLSLNTDISSPIAICHKIMCKIHSNSLTNRKQVKHYSITVVHGTRAR